MCVSLCVTEEMKPEDVKGCPWVMKLGMEKKGVERLTFPLVTLFAWLFAFLILFCSICCAGDRAQGLFMLGQCFPTELHLSPVVIFSSVFSFTHCVGKNYNVD
jgi:hypothetical protein